jgi:hypothetical protein
MFALFYDTLCRREESLLGVIEDLLAYLLPLVVHECFREVLD